MLSSRSWNENGSNLGLVMDGRGRECKMNFDMEKNGPEKHESSSGHEDDLDSDFLSNIDERIEDVLGHFQKEFQGGVPVETLGAQYGGYGSFLRSYQHCPSILSQPRSPVKISNHVSRSPYKLQPKDRHQKPSVPGSTLKENTSNDKSLAEPLKENLSTIPVAASKLKKGILKASKLHKEDSNNKAIESHSGFGISACIQEADGNKHGTSIFIEKSKEKLQLNKVANHQIANSVTDALVFDPLTKNSQTADATATVSTPVIEENWVCCDICQTWRLLPYGTNPDNLPSEWQCSMQVWMPGLNKCYISQDETTKAFHQLYQVPAPVNVNNLSIHPVNSLSSITSSGILNHNGRLENNVCSAPLGGKKKRVLMNASNLPRDSSLSYLSNSVKNAQPSPGSKRLKHEGSLTQHRIRQKSTSGGHTIEKYDHKVEKPFKNLASCPNEGDLFENCSKQSMSRCKRQVDKDDQRSSKKVEKDKISHYEKDLHTEDPRVARKVLQSSENQNHSSSGEHRKHVRASDAKHPDKYDFKDKKRKLKELQVSDTHHKNSMTSRRIANDRPMIKFGSSEIELRRLKKAKVEKFEGQDSSAVFLDGEMDKNGCPQPTASATKCSPLKKDGVTTVNAFIQEARELKHTADHLKNEGLRHESSGIYFEASLKFLHVASLMETTNSETARQGELFPSQQMLQMYLETALLCEFCAREYENLKEMAAAALAYKCAEVAYMKVAYFKHPSANKDRHDLQAALDTALPDEPSSSPAYDVNNLNNQGDSEKAVSVRANGSLQIAGNHVIAAQNRLHVKRLLTFAKYLNCAFEATNKSQNAITIASIDLKNDRVESLCSVRKVLDFNFYNVEGLLQLVRISLNSISSKE